MAVTKGHGNPKWTRDETILALNLYHCIQGNIPSGSDVRIVELSRLLRSFPIHSNKPRRKSFRNPDGVVFKLLNLHKIATGKGLGNTSKMDREVWEELGRDPLRTKKLADLIKASVGILGQLIGDDDVEMTFSEGTIITKTHEVRERNPKLRKTLLQYRKKNGKVKCEMCGRGPYSIHEDLSDAIFEIHHIVPLSNALRINTRLSDLALLCANCHRFLHRAISIKGDWISLAEAKELINTTWNSLEENYPQKSKKPKV